MSTGKIFAVSKILLISSFVFLFFSPPLAKSVEFVEYNADPVQSGALFYQQNDEIYTILGTEQISLLSTARYPQYSRNLYSQNSSKR